MKIETLRKALAICVGLVIMVKLTGCSSVEQGEPYFSQGYLKLSKGQTYTAISSVTLANMSIIVDKDRQIFDLMNALKQFQLKQDYILNGK